MRQCTFILKLDFIMDVLREDQMNAPGACKNILSASRAVVPS